MRVDFHTHAFPLAYLDEVEQHPSAACSLRRDAQGRRSLHYPGDYSIIAATHYDMEARLAQMDQAGIDVGVLTLPTPGVHVEERTRAIQLAQLVNDDLAAIQRKYPRRFVGLATLPLQDPQASADELERAVNRLGLRGAMIFSNVNGQPIHTSAYGVLYETAARLDVPLMIHPTTPAGMEAFHEYRAVALVGFPMDTTLCITLLVLAGVLERFPRLRFVVCHLGGAIPYLAERLDRGYQAYPEVRANIAHKPSFYFQRNCYVDTVAFEPRALQVAIDFLGAERVLLGSDYPHAFGDMRGTAQAIERLPLPAEQRGRMLGVNASQLLKFA